RIYETTTGGTPAGAGGWSRTDQDLTTGTSIFSTGDWISSMSYNAGVLATASFGGAVYVQNGRPTPGLTGWVNVTRNLPVATGTPSAVVIGTDAGTMVCLECINNGAPNPYPPPPPSPVWLPLGSGLPNAKIDALRVSQDNQFLTAWTHGRGAWTLPIASSASFDPTAVAFGDQSVAQASATQTVNLTNRGIGVLNVDSVTVTGANVGDFQIVTQNCWIVTFIGRGCQVKVQFTPQAAGSRSASLSFADNAPGSPQLVPLSGTGVASAVSL